MKFVIHGRYNAALCGHFGEIRKEISTKVWSHNLSGIGTMEPMLNKTQNQKTSLIVSGVRKFSYETFEKQEIGYNFDMYSLKTFLPKFCQDLPVILLK